MWRSAISRSAILFAPDYQPGWLAQCAACDGQEAGERAAVAGDYQQAPTRSAARDHQRCPKPHRCRLNRPRHFARRQVNFSTVLFNQLLANLRNSAARDRLVSDLPLGSGGNTRQVDDAAPVNSRQVNVPCRGNLFSRQLPESAKGMFRMLHAPRTLLRATPATAS